MSIKDFSITKDLNPDEAKVQNNLNSDLTVTILFKDAPENCKPIFLETNIRKDGSLKSVDIRSQMEVRGKMYFGVIEPKVWCDDDDKANIEAKAAKAIEKTMESRGSQDKARATEQFFHLLEDVSLYNAVVETAESVGYKMTVGNDRQFQLAKGEPNGRIHRQFCSNLAEVANAIRQDVQADVAKIYESGQGCWKDDDRFSLVSDEENLKRLAEVSIGEIGDACRMNVNEFRYEDIIRNSNAGELHKLSTIHHGTKVAGKVLEPNEVLYGLQQSGFQISPAAFEDKDVSKPKIAQRGR